MSDTEKITDSLVQTLLPLLTIGTQIAISFDYIQYGMIIGVIAQPFWVYTSYNAYKRAGQRGFLLSSIIMFFLVCVGCYLHRT